MAQHRPSPISKANLARLKGCSRAAVTLAAKGPLKAALLPGGRVDRKHPAVVKFLSEPARAPTATAERAESGAPVPTAPPPLSEAELLGLTFREIVDRFGSLQGMQDWVDARKTVAEVTRLELANATTREEMISRDLVRKSVFGALEECFKRLVGDSPRTIASRLLNSSERLSLYEAETIVRDLISAQLKLVKTRASRALRGEPTPAESGAPS